MEQRKKSRKASLRDQAAAAGKSKEREEEIKGEEGDRSRICMILRQKLFEEENAKPELYIYIYSRF